MRDAQAEYNMLEGTVGESTFCLEESKGAQMAKNVFKELLSQVNKVNLLLDNGSSPSGKGAKIEAVA